MTPRETAAVIEAHANRVIAEASRQVEMLDYLCCIIWNTSARDTKPRSPGDFLGKPRLKLIKKTDKPTVDPSLARCASMAARTPQHKNGKPR